MRSKISLTWRSREQPSFRTCQRRESCRPEPDTSSALREPSLVARGRPARQGRTHEQRRSVMSSAAAIALPVIRNLDIARGAAESLDGLRQPVVSRERSPVSRARHREQPVPVLPLGRHFCRCRVELIETGEIDARQAPLPGKCIFPAPNRRSCSRFRQIRQVIGGLIENASGRVINRGSETRVLAKNRADRRRNQQRRNGLRGHGSGGNRPYGYGRQSWRRQCWSSASATRRMHRHRHIVTILPGQVPSRSVA